MKKIALIITFLAVSVIAFAQTTAKQWNITNYVRVEDNGLNKTIDTLQGDLTDQLTYDQKTFQLKVGDQFSAGLFQQSPTQIVLGQDVYTIVQKTDRQMVLSLVEYYPLTNTKITTQLILASR